MGGHVPFLPDSVNLVFSRQASPKDRENQILARFNKGYLSKQEKQDIVPCHVRLTRSGRWWIADEKDERTSARVVNGERIDIVIVTVIPEEFEAVCKVFGIKEMVFFPDGSPNLYSWRRGTVRHEPSGRHFNVVVGMSGRPTNASSAVTVIDAINLFRPDYILLVGIAGGFAKDGITKGDVVVSNFICGYQYGKIEKVFQPRPHFSYQVDTGLFNAAQSVAALAPSWSARVSRRPENGKRPKCVPGLVASGDMVVDDADNEFFAQVLHHYPGIAAVEMEGAGAALAIQHARDKKIAVGFLMIRGISDMPGRAPASSPVQNPPDGDLSTAAPEQASKTLAGSPAVGAHTTGGSGSQSEERNAWKRYAANSAAHFTFFLITKAWPVMPLSRASLALGLDTETSPDATPSQQSRLVGQVPGEVWQLFVQLYPLGPLQENIWTRSGGEIARLNLRDSGRAQWFSAIELVKNGGGGTSLQRLANTALSDHPGNEQIRNFVAHLE